jgi:hypothetical protein
VRPIPIRNPAAVLAVGCALLAAAAGFMVARASGGQTSPPARAAHASAGPLQVSLPSGWKEQAPPTDQPLALTDELALRPPNAAEGTLVVGRIAGLETGLLPRSFIATLPQAPAPQLVTLGGAQFYRYANLRPRGANAPESVYALPTRVGTILGVCRTLEPSVNLTGRCERILATLKVSSGALGPSLDASYRAGLSATISSLDAARASDELKLRTAPDAHQQAIAASALAAAHAQAANALLRLHPGPASGANSAIATALRMASQAYGALATAAARNDARGYANAQASVARASAALNSALAQLRTFGYRVG